jgi:signal transduction histidine kinase
MHEIRNPLEALNNLLYLALQAKNDPEAVQANLISAQEQVTTLNGIAREVLGFSRSSASAKPVQVSAVVEAALRIHRRTIEAKEIRLQSELPDNVVAELHTGEVLQVVSMLLKTPLMLFQPGAPFA